MMDSEFLSILVCPVCKGPLDWRPDENRLLCRVEKLAFPVRDGVPVLLREEAEELERLPPK